MSEITHLTLRIEQLIMAIDSLREEIRVANDEIKGQRGLVRGQ